MFNKRRFNVAKIFIILFLVAYTACILSITSLIDSPIMFIIALSCCLVFLIILFNRVRCHDKK
jgi:uncharacterized membrane protein YccC